MCGCIGHTSSDPSRHTMQIRRHTRAMEYSYKRHPCRIILGLWLIACFLVKLLGSWWVLHGVGRLWLFVNIYRIIDYTDQIMIELIQPLGFELISLSHEPIQEVVIWKSKFLSSRS